MEPRSGLSRVEAIARSSIFEQLVEDIGPPVVHRSSVSRVTRVSRIARIAGVTDVAEVPKVLIHDHVLIELSDVFPGKFVDVRFLVDLTNRSAIKRVDVVTPPEAHGLPRAL